MQTTGLTVHPNANKDLMPRVWVCKHLIYYIQSETIFFFFYILSPDTFSQSSYRSKLVPSQNYNAEVF